MSFSGDIKELEDVARRMDNEELELEEALKLYERGVALAAACCDFLKNAKQKIETLDAAQGESANDE